MSIEVNDLRVTKLRTYLMSVISELIEQYGEMNINFLSNKPNNYSLDKIPVTSETERWIIGQTINRDVYSFDLCFVYAMTKNLNVINKIKKKYDDIKILGERCNI